MINCAICDDEPSMLEEISHELSAYMNKRQITSYKISRFSEGRSLLESPVDFDIIFLDIQMNPPDGMETARQLRRQKKPSLLIFVTVLKECVFDAFEVQAYDYLVKPLESVRFQRTMDRALRTLEEAADKNLLIQKGNSCEIIPLSQIIYGEIVRRKIYLYQISGKVTEYYGKLEDLEGQVDRRFFKCHRSYLVNLDYVRGCNGGRVLLPQGKEIPVSRLREHDLTQALLRHMKAKT